MTTTFEDINRLAEITIDEMEAEPKLSLVEQAREKWNKRLSDSRHEYWESFDLDDAKEAFE